MAGYDRRVGADPARAGGSDPGLSSGVAARNTIIGTVGSGSRRPAAAILDLSGGPGNLCIRIVDGERRELLALGPFAEEDVIARWRSLLAVSGLVPMLCKDVTDVAVLARQLGRLRLGSARAPTRLGSLTGRRPRFLVKRKTARLPAIPVVHGNRDTAFEAST